MLHKKRLLFISTIVMMWLFSTCFALDVPAQALSETQKIEALILSLKNISDAEFIRNGVAYDVKSASKFLKGKWQSRKDKVTTAEQFIDLVASKSDKTGEPYMIRYKDGKEQTSRDYLTKVLEKMGNKESLQGL